MKPQLSKYRVCVHYPLARGRMVLRCDSDWDHDVECKRSDPQRKLHDFEIQSREPYFYFKPVIIEGDALHWSGGDNYLALAESKTAHEVFPYFFDAGGCSFCEMHCLDSVVSEESRTFRVFLPPGYEENELRRYPVLYMQDGQNLFFPGEAFAGAHWRLPETLTVLDSMNAIEQAIVVGIYPNAREQDYTCPGYEAYGRFLVEELIPHIDSTYRTASGPRHTAVMGSSLGGVVSLFLAWEYPDVFGMAACMSSTFGWRDDLATRIARGARRDIRIYLDSGWPADNYEVTRNMNVLLDRKGYGKNSELLYFAFPQAQHDERSWAMRAHIPFQFFFEQGLIPTSCQQGSVIKREGVLQ